MVIKRNINKWILLLLFLIPITVLSGYYLNYGTKAAIQVNTEPIIIEYGEMIDLNIGNYVNIDEITFKRNDLDKTQEDIYKKVNIDISNLKYVTDSYYLALGEHVLKLTTINPEEDLVITFGNNKIEQEIKIIVQDTIAPEFVDFKEEINTYKDVPLDLHSQYTAQDLDVVTITIDETNIDYTKVGNYKAIVSATDTSGNTKTQEASVVVKAPTIKLNKEKVTIYNTETLKLSATVQGKEKNATYTTSDSSLATVDANGKVTGKKEGTVTITATANGVSDTCKVTVKKEAVKTHTVNSKTIIDISYYFYDFRLSDKSNKRMLETYNTIVNQKKKVLYSPATGKSQYHESYIRAQITLLTDFETDEVKNFFEPTLYQDGDKYYMVIKDEHFNKIRDEIVGKQNEYLKHRVIYRDTIVSALKGMKLNCSDREMVNQINNWICKKLSYKVTNNWNYFEVFSKDKNKGQCYQYAKLFNDMCRAVGVKATYNEGKADKSISHAWNTVTVNDKKYFFDVTWNDTESNGKWSWVSESEFRKRHKW